MPNPFLEKIRGKCQAEGCSGIPGPEDNSAAAREAARKVFQYLVETSHHKALPKDLPGVAQLVIPDLDKIPDVLLKTLFADLKIFESYQPVAEELLDIPITAFHGVNDDRVTLAEMQASKLMTSSYFQCHVLPGDHFFLDKDQNRDSLLDLIAQALSDAVQYNVLK